LRPGKEEAARESGRIRMLHLDMFRPLPASDLLDHACDFKVIANGVDPDKRGHQRKLLISDQLLRCISNILEKLKGTDCEEQW
jgi:hypothetical protein